MTLRRIERTDDTSSGFTGFVRSLLSSIPWSERRESHESLRFEPPSGRLVRLHNANGKTSLFGEERDDILVRATKVARADSEESAEKFLDQIRLASAVIDGALELEVEIPEKWNRRGTLDLEIRLPRQLSVELSAINGRIGIEGMHGEVRVRSSNGAAIIRDVVGDISVATSNAKVCCLRTCGRLVARCRDGKIELQEHRGSVDASTSNGLIRASLEELGDAGIQLATSNGRIVLDLPNEVDAEVDLRVDNGTIRNDRQLCKCTRDRNGRVLGRLGSGGALIKLRTSNGSISLK